MKGISFSNYRVFEKETKFDISPITILTGKNCSGKSSVMKMLKLLNANLKMKGEDVNLIDKISELNFALGSSQEYESHKLGGFSNIISKVNNENGSIKVILSLGMHPLFKKDQKLELIYGANKADNLNNSIIEELNCYIDNKILASISMIPDYRGKSKEEIFEILNNTANVYVAPHVVYNEVDEPVLDESGFDLLNTPYYYYGFDNELIKQLYSEVYRKGKVWEISEFLCRQIYQKKWDKREEELVIELDKLGFSFNKEENINSYCDEYVTYCNPILRNSDREKVKYISEMKFSHGHDTIDKGLKFNVENSIPGISLSPLKDFTYFIYPIINYLDKNSFLNIDGSFKNKSQERIDILKNGEKYDEKIILKYESVLKNYDSIHTLVKDINTIEDYIIKNIFLKEEGGYPKLLESISGGAYSDNEEFVDIMNNILENNLTEQEVHEAMSSCKALLKIPKMSSVHRKLKDIKELASINMSVSYREENANFTNIYNSISRGLYEEVYYSIFRKGLYLGTEENKHIKRFITYMERDIAIFNSVNSLTNVVFVDAIRGNVDRFYSDSSHQTNKFVHLLMEFNKRNYSNNSPEILWINKWINEFEIGDSFVVERLQDIEGTKVYILNDGRKEMLADLGFGVTQFLPLLLHSVMHRDKLICIEEPETNLHPMLQSKLADLFVDATKEFNNKFLLETHSEYLIRKLQYLVKDNETNISSSDISLNYLNKDSSSDEKVYQIKIKSNGTLDRPLGKGFLDESSNLLVGLMTGKL